MISLYKSVKSRSFGVKVNPEPKLGYSRQTQTVFPAQVGHRSLEKLKGFMKEP